MIKKVFPLHFDIEVREELIICESTKDETRSFFFDIRVKTTYIIDIHQICLEKV